MAKIAIRRRLVNPGKRRARRKLSPKQIKYFGTPAQKAALKRKRVTNAGRNSFRKTKKKLKRYPAISKGYLSFLTGRVKAKRRARRKARKVATRVGNVGQIITVGLSGNPGKKRGAKKLTMARRKRRSTITTRRRRVTRRRRTTNPTRHFAVRHRRRRSYTRRRRHANPGVRRHRRAVGYRRRRVSRHRNPGMFRSGMFSGTVGTLIGLAAGAAITKIVDKFVPIPKTGIIGYASLAASALATGFIIRKVTKNSTLAKSAQLGGLFLVALNVLHDFAPGVFGYLPFGLSGGRGMGLISSSSFYTPQVNMPGSMATFVAPAAAAVAAAPGHGMGMLARRTARTGRVM